MCPLCPKAWDGWVFRGHFDRAKCPMRRHLTSIAPFRRVVPFLPAVLFKPSPERAECRKPDAPAITALERFAAPHTKFGHLACTGMESNRARPVCSAPKPRPYRSVLLATSRCSGIRHGRSPSCPMLSRFHGGSRASGTARRAAGERPAADASSFCRKQLARPRDTYRPHRANGSGAGPNVISDRFNETNEHFLGPTS